MRSIADTMAASTRIRSASHDRHRVPLAPDARACRTSTSRWSTACSRSPAPFPGYISHKGFWAEDGERVTIVEFEHEEGQRAWRMHPEHIEAQKLGRLKYYEMYDIKIGEVMLSRAISSGKSAAKRFQGLDRRPPLERTFKSKGQLKARRS